MLDILSTWIWGVLFFSIHGRYIIDRSPSTTVHCQLDTSPDISERPEKRLVPELSRYEAQALTWRSNKLGMKYHEEIRCFFQQKKVDLFTQTWIQPASECWFDYQFWWGDVSMKRVDVSMKNRDFTSQPIETPMSCSEQRMSRNRQFSLQCSWGKGWLRTLNSFNSNVWP